MHKIKLSDEYRENLLQIMSMGFMNFDSNLEVLKKCDNRLDEAMAKMLGFSNN